MVHFVHLISAAALFSVSSAAPMVRRDDSAIGSEIPVSAPNGTPMSDPVPAPTDASYGYSGSSGGGSSGYSSPSYGSSGYGSSGYGSSDSAPSYGSGSSWDSSSMDDSSMEEATSTYWSSSSESAWTSSETMASETSSASYSQMTYGSGSSSWGGSGYDSCVQQCAASFGQPSVTWTPSATQSSDSGSSGSGITHTVIVAPTQGVLRYIPFSTNASIGDTVSFQWGAGPHTVTQSSALEVCNKTSIPTAFASGMQNKSFVFNQVVNDTKPIWFYCGVPGHCQKGMFGGINIGQADPTGSDSSSSTSTSSSYMPLSSMISNITSMSSDMTALWGYTKSKTSSDAYANNWGMSTDCSGMTPDAMMQTAENVMYMQTLIAANPKAVTNGKFAVTDANSLTIPPDLQQALATSTTNSTGNAASGSGSSAGSASSVSAAPAAASTTAKPNGAGSLASPSVIVGLVAVVATFFAL